MKLPRPLLLVLLLAASLPGRAADLPPAVRERLAGPSRPAALVADFTESRHTPLKKKPVVLTGTVRIDRELGLSLDYSRESAPLLILDSAGLLLRHPDGREQEPPPEAAPELRLLRALFAFDFPALREAYELSSSTDGAEGWTLRFTRRPESDLAYRELVLEGDATRLARVLLVKTPNLRTEILLDPPRFAPAFTPEERARYFR